MINLPPLKWKRRIIELEKQNVTLSFRKKFSFIGNVFEFKSFFERLTDFGLTFKNPFLYSSKELFCSFIGND